MNEVWKKPPITLDAYQKMVGHEVGVSSWHLVDQSRINVYADVIEDHQFIHVDPERAKRETAFGNTVAHGFLTMSLMSIMSYEVMPVIEGTTMGVNYGFDKLRFLSPVRAGSRVRGRFTLTEATLRKPTELLSTHQRHGRDRGRDKAGSGGRLDRSDLFRLKPPSSWPGLLPGNPCGEGGEIERSEMKPGEGSLSAATDPSSGADCIRTPSPTGEKEEWHQLQEFHT